MGTASTLTSLVEALGMCLPGTASIPAVDAARHRAAEATGRRAVELAHEHLRPSQVLTADAFDNAITVLEAIGGSTNAVIHLLALAGRVGVALTLDRFDEISRRTPVLANLRPSGEFLVEHFHHAGGVQALLKELEPLLNVAALTVTGRTLADGFASAQVRDRNVIAALDAPLASEGGIEIGRGSLAPDGAVIKRSAASPSLLDHRGPAVVFGTSTTSPRESTIRRSRSGPTRCSCCATRDRRVARACPNGGSCRFPAGCSERASPTSCVSRTRA